MCEFIVEHRARFGVVPICAVLSEHGWKIAPRTFYAWLSRAPSKRALWDMTITEILAGFYQPDYNGRRRPESLYGSLKMWAHLNREGIGVARCTIERLMGVNGWHGVTRTKKVRTTISDPASSRAPDLVDRQFKVGAPNQLVVADFTHVAMATASFAYTAFVIDAYADRSAGNAQRRNRPLLSNPLSDKPQPAGHDKGHPSKAAPSTIPMPNRSTYVRSGSDSSWGCTVSIQAGNSSAFPFKSRSRLSRFVVSMCAAETMSSLIASSPPDAADPRRAVVLGVSPRTVKSCDPGWPTTPTYAMPVWTPTPAGKESPRSGAAKRLRASFFPAATARSGWDRPTKPGIHIAITPSPTM